MKRQVMQRAHEIARTLEGHYHARMSLALRQAWAEMKAQAAAPQTVLYAVNHQPSGGKEWVARITGRHPRYKFNREFLAPIQRDWSWSGKTGRTFFELAEGEVYEVNVPWKGRRFVTVQNGQVIQIDAAEVMNRIA